MFNLDFSTRMAFRYRPVFKVVSGLHYYIFLVTLGGQPFLTFDTTLSMLQITIL